MAMNILELAELMRKKVNELIDIKKPEEYQNQYYIALATAIVEHIQQKAEVNGGRCIDRGSIEKGRVS